MFTNCKYSIISTTDDLDKLLSTMDFRCDGMNPRNTTGWNIIGDILGCAGRVKGDETKSVLSRNSQEEKEDACLNFIGENMHWMFNLLEDQMDELLERKDINKLCLLSEELRR